MERLRLVFPSADYAEEIAAYRRETLENDGGISGGGGLEHFAAPPEWLHHLERMAKRETCPAGYVPSLQYLSVRAEDGRVVGMVNLRLELNEYLSRFGGHIGYSVRPSERGKGYAKEQLRLALETSRSLGIGRALLTCAVGNEASRRTILSAGGVFDGEELDESDGEITQRYWISLTGSPPSAPGNACAPDRPV